MRGLKFGRQFWQFGTLNTRVFRNGEKLAEAFTREQLRDYSNKGVPAFHQCTLPNGQPGKSYNREAVMDSRGLAPTGWSIPTTSEWTELFDFLDPKCKGEGIKPARFCDKVGNRYLETKEHLFFSDFLPTLQGANQFAYAWTATPGNYGGLVQMRFNYGRQVKLRLELQPLDYTAFVKCFQVLEDDNQNPKSNYHPPQPIKIGNQIWSKENLNVTCFKNGDQIPRVLSGQDWLKQCQEKKPAYCYFQNDTTKSLLYNKFAILDKRSIAPEGWHIPKKSEWEVLFKHVSTLGPLGVGRALKMPGRWRVAGYYSNFNAIPTGIRNDGDFIHGNYATGWWVSPDNNADDNVEYNIIYDGLSMISNYRRDCDDFNDYGGLCVRLIKDEN